MDNKKIGDLIRVLRKEKNMTQIQLANLMNLSDRTISKWERGKGAPDVSLLNDLSKVLNVNIEKILLGDLQANDTDGGNMKKIKFYQCPNCGNVIAATGEADISCCSRKLSPMVAKPADESHSLKVEESDGEYYITFSHEMTKEHYLNFIALVGFDRMIFVKLYPEQSGEVRIQMMHGAKLYFGCSRHGLWRNQI